MSILTQEQLAMLQRRIDGCPFCGSADVHIMQGTNSDIRFECDSCYACVHFDGGARFAPSLSVERWNRRRATKHTTSVPTLEEVEAYCSERQNGINPQSFIDYYDARGWKLSNGCKVKDWRALVRRWEQLKRQRDDKKKDDEHRRGVYGSLDIDEIERSIKEEEAARLKAADKLYKEVQSL